MQKLEMIKNSGQTVKSSKINKKSKVSSNPKKTAKSNLQFSEIFGQISSSLQSAPVNNVKQTPASQPESKGNSVKTVKTGAVSIRHIDASTESTPGKTEVKLATIENLKQLEQIEKAAATAGAESMAVGAKSIDPGSEVTKGKTEAKLANIVDPKQPEQLEKTAANAGTESMAVEGKSIDPGSEATKGKTEAKLATIVHPKQLDKAAASVSAREVTAQSDTKQLISSPSEIQTNSGSELSGIEKAELTSTNGKRQSESTSENMGTNANKSVAPSEIKIADLILASDIRPMENKDSQTTEKDLHLKKEVSINSISSDRTSSDILVNSQKNSKNGDKEAGADTASAKKTPHKAEITQNALNGENRVVEFKVDQSTGLNIEKPMLNKSQADLLVSKMIEQIKVAPSSLEISLKPEYLGKVNILVQSIEGIISVNVIAQNTDALNLLNASLHNIKDDLIQQGINVQQLDVSLANQEEQNNQGGSGYREQMQAMQLSEESKLMTEYADYPGGNQSSSVSYEINILA